MEVVGRFKDALIRQIAEAVSIVSGARGSGCQSEDLEFEELKNQKKFQN